MTTIVYNRAAAPLCEDELNKQPTMKSVAKNAALAENHCEQFLRLPRDGGDIWIPSRHCSSIIETGNWVEWAWPLNKIA